MDGINKKWNKFAESGKISDYLDYCQVKPNSFTRGDSSHASEFGRTDNKGELYRGE